jgi:hypothetical protein
MLAYGVRIGVRTTDPEMQAELHKLLPYGARIISQPLVETIYSIKVGGVGKRPGLKLFNLAFAGATQIARSLNLADTLDALVRDIQLHIAENARNRVFIHAGVLGWQNQAIVIPGRSLSGKSTLVRELVRAGATYYSDEYAVLDSHGRVHPYPTPIGVRKNPLEKQEKYPIETFGGTIGTKPLPVGLVLATGYKEGARWRPKRIPAGQGLLAIMANTVSAQRNPAKALSTLQQVVLKAPVLKGVRGETGEVVEALLNRPWPTL